MSLVANWRRVLLHAWSVWCNALAIAVIVADVALPAFGESLGLPPRALAIVSGLLVAAAIPARIFVQRSVSGEER